jgi:hypothetical protein
MKTLLIALTLALGYVAVQALIYAMQAFDMITGYGL